MRIYVPATLDELDAASVTADAARWTLAPRLAHAVTPALLAALPDEDDEGHEYAAALEAADDSLALVAARPDAPRQRLVLTLDVPDDVVEPAEGAPGAGDDLAPSAVHVARTLPDHAIVCVHVDEPEAAADVEAVLAAADEESDAEEAGELAEGTTTALDEALQRVTDRDLLWYDWSELPAIPRS